MTYLRSNKDKKYIRTEVFAKIVLGLKHVIKRFEREAKLLTMIWLSPQGPVQFYIIPYPLPLYSKFIRKGVGYDIYYKTGLAPVVITKHKDCCISFSHHDCTFHISFLNLPEI